MKKFIIFLTIGLILLTLTTSVRATTIIRGDLNNNQIPFDRQDVILSIAAYLSSTPPATNSLVYDLNQNGYFDRQDVISFITNYLAKLNPSPSPTLTPPSNPIRGVGNCHWLEQWRWDHTNVRWGYVTSQEAVWWSTLNPADDKYNIQPLIDFIEERSREAKNGQKFMVQLYLAGYNRRLGKKKYPQWLVDKGAVYVPRQDDGTFVPWNPIFKKELGEFLTAINSAFQTRWGRQLENKPTAFEGIVVWSGGYYGEMATYYPPNWPLWDRLASQKLGIPTSDPSFRSAYDKLWVDSAINLGSLYAHRLSPQIKLLFHLAYYHWYYWHGQRLHGDEAAAMELMSRFPYRFYFKFNGWDYGMPAGNYQWIMYNIKHFGKSLGVGYEVGHGVNHSRWMVDYALGINDYNGLADGYQGPTGIPANFKVDFVCIQPQFWAAFDPVQLHRLEEALNP